MNTSLLSSIIRFHTFYDETKRFSSPFTIRTAKGTACECVSEHVKAKSGRVRFILDQIIAPGLGGALEQVHLLYKNGCPGCITMLSEFPKTLRCETGFKPTRGYPRNIYKVYKVNPVCQTHRTIKIFSVVKRNSLVSNLESTIP